MNKPLIFKTQREFDAAVEKVARKITKEMLDDRLAFRVKKETANPQSVMEMNSQAGRPGGNVGFYGTPAIPIQTVTGSTGYDTALTSLLRALANLGLIINRT